MDLSRNSLAGAGLGLRTPHYNHILENLPDVPWFEAISENFLGLDVPGGKPLRILEAIRSAYPLALHGVSLSIGSADPVNLDYVRRLKALFERFEPAIVSDHLCWTGVDGENVHDLLPLPYTEEAANHVVRKVTQVQELLGRQILLENVSAYVAFESSEMTEWEFLTEITRRSDCLLLLDVNNIYVSATNLKFDAMQFLRGVPPRAVRQMHLAGHSQGQTLLIDTHDHPVPDPVWALYREALNIFGPVPTLIEWDDQIPEFDVLHDEARKAQRLLEQVHG